LNHLDQARLQLTRSPYKLPALKLNRKPDSLFDYRYDDFIIEDYQAYEHIKAPISV
jgi:thymidylate synthase